jgi:AcrR family transcriptional regulator
MATGEMQTIERPLPRGPHRLTRETVLESQRGRMLDAIAVAVADKGYAATTVGDVVSGAGVSRKTFYEHFADKEECFLAAYDQVADELFAAIAEETRRARNPREALELGIAKYFTQFADHPRAAATFVVEIHRAGERALARRAEIHARYRELVALAPKAVERQRTGNSQPPAAAVEAVTYTIDAMTHDYVRQGRAHELPELIPAAQELALHVLSV